MRLRYILAAVIMLINLCGCTINNNGDGSNNTSSQEEIDKKQDEVEEVGESLDGLVGLDVFKMPGLSIGLSEVTKIDNVYKIKYSITNESEEQGFTAKFNSITINDVTIGSFAGDSVIVSVGESKELDIKITEEELAERSIESIVNIGCTLVISNDYTGDITYTDHIVVGNDGNTVIKLPDDAVEVYNSAGLLIKSFMNNEGTIKLYIENHSDKDISTQVNEISVNGEKELFVFYAITSANSVGLYDLIIQTEDNLKEADIDVSFYSISLDYSYVNYTDLLEIH